MTTTDDGLALIDAHHHFWDPVSNDHPWLREQPLIPFRYGDYSAICKPFLPADYAAVTAHHNVVASITMEGEWNEADLVAESQWMSEIHDRFGTPAAHVARAVLHRDDVRDVLQGHARFPLVRGIRHKPVAAPRPDAVEKGRPGGLSDPAWQQGFSQLSVHGFHFELQAPWWHIDELLDIADRYPDTPIVINHGFMPQDRSKDGLRGWRRAVRRAAEMPHAAMKISGIAIAGRTWVLDDHMSVIYALLEAFDVDRCMFASNFPVDGLCGSFEIIFDGYRAAVADVALGDQQKLFHDNAARVYRIESAARHNADTEPCA